MSVLCVTFINIYDSYLQFDQEGVKCDWPWFWWIKDSVDVCRYLILHVLINILEPTIGDCIVIAPIPPNQTIDYKNDRPPTRKRRSIKRKWSKIRRVHHKPRHEDMPSLNSHHRSLHESNQNKRRKLNGFKAVVERIQRDERTNPYIHRKLTIVLI